jgi:hypothetical protein
LLFRQRIERDWGYADADAGKPPVRVGDRWIPETIEAHFLGADGQPELHLTIETRAGGVPECSEVRLTRAPDGRAVRTLDLRAVKIADWVNDIAAMFAARVVEERESGEVVAAVTGSDTDEFEAARELQRARTGGSARKLDRAFLERVAKVYRDHVDDKPTKAVSAAFGVKRAMASKYVRMCRDKGLLGETSPGKKGT